MQCDQCDNEATVHEVTVVGGKRVEKHLCESCAREQGLTVQPNEPINALLSKFIMAPGLVQQAVTGGKSKGEPQAPACPECSMTWMEFRKSGVLGCAKCYEAFESRLAPLIERAQEGATHHVGKAPRGSAGLADHQRTLRTLRAELAEAIASEQYEHAAQIRDSISDIEAQVEQQRADAARRVDRGLVGPDDPEGVTPGGAGEDPDAFDEFGGAS
ncbi:MAG: UvrB/UvrC motif-containing protein [Phycisphaeraceae bacterium]|nr:UvrB/UvrC motif-containing protein [Phycisphaeraceae bacterium]MCB9848135.1 UvrB/UvrC motif-containing protein [Phycisphaeraceae bacterium]